MLIIGLGYRARQGKNLVSDTILEACANREIEARIYEFSAEVSAYCVEYGLFADAAPRDRKTLEVLQRVGLEMRQQDPTFWINRLWGRLRADSPQVALIPNLRFPNEAERVKADGGACVLVERFNADGSQYIDPDRDPNSSFENALRAWPWDYRLAARSGQSAWLCTQARALFRHLRCAE